MRYDRPYHKSAPSLNGDAVAQRDVQHVISKKKLPTETALTDKVNIGHHVTAQGLYWLGAVTYSVTHGNGWKHAFFELRALDESNASARRMRCDRGKREERKYGRMTLLTLHGTTM